MQRRRHRLAVWLSQSHFTIPMADSRVCAQIEHHSMRFPRIVYIRRTTKQRNNQAC